MPKRYRVETYSGDVVEAEVVDLDKNTVAVRLVGGEGEMKVVIEKFVDDNTVLVNVNNNIYRVKIIDEGVFINDETSLISKIIELIPIGTIGGRKAKKTMLVHRKGEIRAPLSGKILDVKVKPGDRVSVGDVLVLMESMKMVTEVKSDINGVVEEVLIEPGKAVAKGTLLIKIKAVEETMEKKTGSKKKK